jgi:cytochrome c biogenesis protein CcmG, thiol:disulfide interchange protein DsbE
MFVRHNSDRNSPISPLFPIDTSYSPVTLCFPYIRKNRGRGSKTSQPSSLTLNVGAPTFPSFAIQFPFSRQCPFLGPRSPVSLYMVNMNRPRPSPHARVGWILLLGVLAIAAMAVLVPWRGKAQGQPVIRFVRDPDPAPDFAVKDLDGKPLTLAGLHGKVVLLNFWATWCGPCRTEIPSLVALQSRYQDKLQIVGMLTDDDDLEAVRSVMKGEGINYPVAMATTEIRIEYGGIPGLPTLFVINADGRVVQKHVGLYNPALYETEVRALLDLPIPAKVETFEDTGEIFLKHADRASMLPGVNMSKLTAEQRIVALHKLNAQTCDCGCNYTLAQCRIYDPQCQLSAQRAADIVKEAAGGAKPAGEQKPAEKSEEKP